jgi:hypothetical protein
VTIPQFVQSAQAIAELEMRIIAVTARQRQREAGVDRPDEPGAYRSARSEVLAGPIYKIHEDH